MISDPSIPIDQALLDSIFLDRRFGSPWIGGNRGLIVQIECRSVDRLIRVSPRLHYLFQKAQETSCEGAARPLDQDLGRHRSFS